MLELTYLTYYLISLFIVLLGPFIGSYFALLVFRSNYDLRLNSDRRSQCDKCGTLLKWHELIPVLSFIFLRGKCRSCGKRIDFRHFISELLGLLTYLGIGTIALDNFWFDEVNLTSWIVLIFYFLFLTVLLYLAIYDAYTFSIPAKLINISLLFFVVVSVFLNIGRTFFDTSYIDLGLANIDGIFMGIILGILTYSLIVITKQKGMGEGDIWVASLIGFVLGWPLSFMAVYFAIVVGGLVGLGLLIYKGKIKGEIIPFVPFLLIGTSLSIMFGEIVFNSLFFTI